MLYSFIDVEDLRDQLKKEKNRNKRLQIKLKQRNEDLSVMCNSADLHEEIIKKLQEEVETYKSLYENACFDSCIDRS